MSSEGSLRVMAAWESWPPGHEQKPKSGMVFDTTKRTFYTCDSRTLHACRCEGDLTNVEVGIFLTVYKEDQ